jgi:hypothetical protein
MRGIEISRLSSPGITTLRWTKEPDVIGEGPPVGCPRGSTSAPDRPDHRG